MSEGRTVGGYDQARREGGGWGDLPRPEILGALKGPKKALETQDLFFFFFFFGMRKNF